MENVNVLKEQKLNVNVIKGILLITTFFAMLNETSVNVSLGKFMDEFGVSVSTVQWLISGFMLTMSIIVPTTAFIMKKFTTRKIYFSSLACLIFGTVITGFALSFQMLLIGRIIQAAGTCVLMTLLINSMLILTEPHKRGEAMGVVSLIVLFAPALAPTLSGIIIQNLGWKLIFLGLLPFFILFAILAYKYLANISETENTKLDVFSIILSIFAFGGIFYGISAIGEKGEFSRTIILSLLVGVVFLALFVWRQLTVKEPLLELRVFKYPMYTLGMAMILISMMTIFGVMLLVPIFLQSAIGLTSIFVGLAMLPGGIVNGIVSPLVGKSYDKYGPKPFLFPGVLLAVIVCFGFYKINSDISITLFIVLHCLLMAGIAIIMTTSQTNGLNQLPKRLSPHGTAIMSTIMQLAGGLGSAIYIMVLSINQKKFALSSTETGEILAKNSLAFGFNETFKVIALVLIIGLVISLFVKKSNTEK